MRQGASSADPRPKGGAVMTTPVPTNPDLTGKVAIITGASRGIGAAAFNNAGDGHMPAPLADVAVDDFDRAVRVNLRGVFLCMKYEIRAMLESGGGAIVNMSSTAGLNGVRG